MLKQVQVVIVMVRAMMAAGVKAVMMARVVRIAVQAAVKVVGQGAVRVLQKPIGGRGGRPV